MEQATTEPPLQPWSRWKLERWHIVLIVIAGLLLIGVAVVVESGKHKAGPATGVFTVSVTSATDGNNADVDVYNDGHWSQASNQRLPWSETVGTGYLSVAAQDRDIHGTITCTIRSSDGSVRDTQTSTGSYAEVACSANPGNSGSSGSTGNSASAGNS